MISDERQKDLFLLWVGLAPDEFTEWIEEQPDKTELYALGTALEASLSIPKKALPPPDA